MCMYVYVCLFTRTDKDLVLPQNIHHLFAGLINGFCGHGNGDGGSEMNIRELGPLLLLITI